jgi:hypothetical protein
VAAVFDAPMGTHIGIELPGVKGQAADVVTPLRAAVACATAVQGDCITRPVRNDVKVVVEVAAFLLVCIQPPPSAQPSPKTAIRVEELLVSR